MTARQTILKALYPLVMKMGQLFHKSAIIFNKENVRPTVPFYSLTATFNNGQVVSFNQYKGKKVLIVNTASDCGFTNQFKELQQLYLDKSDSLVILAFPANDFKEQEKGSDEEIANFCRVKFEVSFPLMKKSTVVKSRDQNEVYKWLTDSSYNGWNNKFPEWNFSKYLIDENGNLTHYFGPAVSPLSNKFKEHL